MNSRRASSRGSSRRAGAGEREMGQRQRRVALAGLRQRAAHVRRGRSVERAADGDRDQRDGALALRRLVAPFAARLGELRPRAERSARRRSNSGSAETSAFAPRAAQSARSVSTSMAALRLQSLARKSARSAG